LKLEPSPRRVTPRPRRAVGLARHTYTHAKLTLADQVFSFGAISEFNGKPAALFNALYR
jgi:hypothetical protein